MKFGQQEDRGIDSIRNKYAGTDYVIIFRLDDF